ncbi:MAG: dTMP kinase [Candidatus Thorarchaeota archaeon]
MKKTYRGLFITFEGIDGCGKTTQARRLYNSLKRRGYPVLFIREPGGTPVSERIRRVLLNDAHEITPLTELFLYEAARAQLAEAVILPELRKGTIVVCDRYYDSTTAYQGYGRGLDQRLIKMLNELASLRTPPDLTFIFDVDYETSMTRRKKKADRLERESRAFFNRIRRGFRKIAGEKRVVIIDGRDDIAALAATVREHVYREIERRKIRAAP